MSALNHETSTGQWVAVHPELAHVFDELGIDYCCHGDRSIAEACDAHGLITDEVIEHLEQVVSSVPEHPGTDWTHAALTDLCDHIEATHHAFLRRELPHLESLIAKVFDAHGNAHPELGEVQNAFRALRAELTPHMMKEEQILFPAVRATDQADGAQEFCFNTVAHPIRVMEQEHSKAGDALSRLRTLTENYTVPPDACNSYRAMIEELRHLESDMHQHIHKENNILFPRAIAAEAALAASCN